MSAPRNATGIRLLAIALKPAIRVAVRADLSLEEFTHVAQRGYFEQLQGDGVSFSGLARRLGKSRRTIAVMAKRFREQKMPKPLSDRAEHEQSLFATLIEARGQIRRSNLDEETWARFRHTAERLMGVVDLRLTDDCIFADAERYAYLTDDVERRLGSADKLMGLVADVLDSRFLSRAPSPPYAFVRVLSSRTAESIQALIDRAYEAGRDVLVVADAGAGREGSASIRTAFLSVEIPDGE